MKQLHEAGCAASSIAPFGIRHNEEAADLTITEPDLLVFRRNLTIWGREADVERVVRSMTYCCGATEINFFRNLMMEGISCCHQ